MGTASLSPLNNGTLRRPTLLSPRLAVPGSLLCRLCGPLHLLPFSLFSLPLHHAALCLQKKPHTLWLALSLTLSLSLSLSLLLFVSLSFSLLFLLRSPGGLGLDVPHRRRRVAFPSTRVCLQEIRDKRSSDSFFEGGAPENRGSVYLWKTRRSGVSGNERDVEATQRGIRTSLCSTVYGTCLTDTCSPVTVTNDARGSKVVGSHARSS